MQVNGKVLIIGFAAVVAVAAVSTVLARNHRLAYDLVAAPAQSIPSDPALVAFAHKVAGPVYAKNCASCHGADMKGNQAIGAPNLVDKVWLYDTGQVADIERLILYGVRSGHSKSRNITDMPAVGRLGVLNTGEIHDTVEFIIALSKQPADPVAAERGRLLFRDKGNCYDCHAPDGTGNPDYGSTDFTSGVWTWGGDRVTLFQSVRNGRHGKMDAYIDKLSPVQIRALAVDIYERSHGPAQVAAK